MRANLLTFFRGIPARIEEGGARHGLAYAWWIPAICAVGTVTLAIIALVQRDALLPPRLVSLAPIVLVGAFLLEFLTCKWMPWWMTTPLLIGSVAWLMADASGVSRPIDMAPAILAFVCAQITATDGVRIGAFVTTTSIAVVATFGLDGRMLHVLEILLGLMVGAMLRWQMRALVAERAARTGDRERATLAERQRIAREIHDLVGHSLSVTLLHVTGARRALSEDGDVPDAIEALSEAERIGRQAMADIRRTVHVLATESEDAHPLPTAADVDQLVADVRTAGLRVSYRTNGDPDSLPPSAGLGIYRVAQESLANVAKHAPREQVDVRLDITGREVRLEVRNRRPTPHTPQGRDGSGITGMTSRAEQLGGRCCTGPRGDEWVVDFVVPIAPPAEPVERADPDCTVRRLLR